MGWLVGRLRQKPKKPRLKKEKYPVPFVRRASSGWKVLDDQILLEHWFRSNGIK